MRISIIVSLFLSLATVASVHADEQRDMHRRLEQRIDLMNLQKDTMDFLTDMATGRVAFNAKKIRTARRTLIATTKRIPQLFRKEITGLKSYAAPNIWYNRRDFEQRAENATTAAKAISPRSLEKFRPSLSRMVNTCITCHQNYRLRANEFITH